MNIKPIRTQSDYEEALKKIETLLDAEPGTPQADHLDILVTLVEAYEDRHYALPEPTDPVAVLEYYMESRGLSRSDLERILGSRSRLSEVLNRKRNLSIEMIRRLHAELGISADLLIGVSQLPQEKAAA